MVNDYLNKRLDFVKWICTTGKNSFEKDLHFDFHNTIDNLKSTYRAGVNQQRILRDFYQKFA